MNGPHVCEPKIRTVSRSGLASATLSFPSAVLVITLGIVAPRAGAWSGPRCANAVRHVSKRKQAMFFIIGIKQCPDNIVVGLL